MYEGAKRCKAWNEYGSEIHHSAVSLAFALFLDACGHLQRHQQRRQSDLSLFALDECELNLGSTLRFVNNDVPRLELVAGEGMGDLALGGTCFWFRVSMSAAAVPQETPQDGYTFKYKVH